LRRLVRFLAFSALASLGAAWLAPALFLRFGLGPMAARAGGVAEVTSAWPALPFGASAAKLRLARDGREIQLDDFRAVLLPSGPRLDARIANGTLLVRGEGLLAESGFVRVQDVDLESLAALLARSLAVRGRADGVWRFGPEGSIEGTVSRGAVSIGQPTHFEVPFAQLVVSAARAPGEDGAWNVRWVDVQGPPLSASASGTIDGDGRIQIRAEVRQLEEPVRGLFALMRLPTEPLPLTLPLEGTLAAPRIAAGSATPEPAAR
jgi:hypothetical protein